MPARLNQFDIKPGPFRCYERIGASFCCVGCLLRHHKSVSSETSLLAHRIVLSTHGEELQYRDER